MIKSKRSKGYFLREFFQRAFCWRAISQGAFFFGRIGISLLVRLRMLNLVFKETIYNIFCSRNLQILSLEIAISRLKCLNILFLKNNKKQNWLVETYCKLQCCSFLIISLSIIIPWRLYRFSYQILNTLS